jgi:hypothetical protein
MGAIVGGELNSLHGPTFTVWQVFLFESWKKRLNLLEGVVVGEVINLGCKGLRIAHDIVFQKYRQVHKFSFHMGSKKDILYLNSTDLNATLRHRVEGE